MRHILRATFLFAFILFTLCGTMGCNTGGGGNGGGGGGGGGGNLVVGDIQGSNDIDENATAQFSITATGDTGITYAWLCDPAELGDFNAPSSPQTVLTVGVVTEDTPIEISIVVQSDHSEPIIKKKTVIILDVPGLWVGEIIGADGIDENAWGIYSVDAGGDTGITYSWTTNMPSVGEFESADSEETKFSVGEVWGDTLVEISVDVQSDNYGPIQRTKSVFISEVFNLWVSEIDGPDEIDEESEGTFEVEAGGDTGITYMWSCEPADAGEFAAPISASTHFTTSVVASDMPVEIRVDVESSYHLDAVRRTKNITIINDPELIVGEIDGPDEMVENTSETYSIDAGGDNGIAYAWICTPPDAGEFDEPMSASPQFTAHDVNGNLEVELKTIVHSDLFGPEVRIKTITIVDLGSEGWARTWGGVGDDGCNGVAVDNWGNIYTTGYFADDVDFDPGDYTESRTAEGDYDIFLGKFSSQGDFQWVLTWGGDESLPDYYNPTEQGVDVEIDDSGNIYVTGFFNSDADLNPGPGSDMHYGGGIFLSRFDPDGVFQWARSWAFGDSYGEIRPNGLKLDGSGNIYIAGDIDTVVDFDPGPGTDEHGFLHCLCAFLCKYDQSGEYQWARAWGPNDWENFCNGIGVAVDNAGNPYVAGSFNGYFDFDPGGGAEYLGAYYDVYLSKFNPDGEFQWARDWGGDIFYDFGDHGYGIAADNGGGIYVTGYFGGTFDFDPGTGVDYHTGFSDGFISKFDTDGEYQWAKTWGGGFDTSDSGHAATRTASGNILLSCYSSPSDIHLKIYTPTGSSGWAVTVGGPGKDMALDVASCKSGSHYASGYYRATVDFEPGSGVTEYTSHGEDDCFLLKVLPSGGW